MPSTVLLAGLSDEVVHKIKPLAEESGFSIELAANRDECQEVLLNREILLLIIHAAMVKADPRIIEVMKFYSNSVQFIIYSDDKEPSDLSALPRSDLIGILKDPGFSDFTLSDFFICAIRLQSLEKKIESLNFVLQENHSTASELNLKNKVLERERNFNNSIISSIAYGLMIVDSDNAIMLINEMGKNIFGITIPDFYGMNYETVIFEGIRESLIQNAKDVIKHHKTLEVEGFTVREDLIISYSISVIKDNFGNLIGLMFLGRNVTEWENMTHQLFQAEKLATMGTMLSGIAHELRNPVTIINARAQRILQMNEATSPEKIKKAVESIENQSKRMGEIINNLLDFSRRNVSGFTSCDINQIIDTSLNFLSLEGKAMGIEVIKSFRDSCVTRCDRNQLEQVFLNLFSNACDAMGNQGKLFLTTENTENYIRISVRDTGCGIPEEIKKKIFDPFFTTKEAGKGTGLGLAIVYKIIQAHKGRLIVKSKVGQGTTFIIMLPKGH